MNEITAVFVGIDVSKAVLDVAIRPSGTTLRFSNDEAGIAALVAEVKNLVPALIVLEDCRPKYAWGHSRAGCRI